jgi:hypothetical protein
VRVCVCYYCLGVTGPQEMQSNKPNIYTSEHAIEAVRNGLELILSMHKRLVVIYPTPFVCVFKYNICVFDLQYEGALITSIHREHENNASSLLTMKYDSFLVRTCV